MAPERLWENLGDRPETERNGESRDLKTQNELVFIPEITAGIMRYPLCHQLKQSPDHFIICGGPVL